MNGRPIESPAEPHQGARIGTLQRHRRERRRRNLSKRAAVHWIANFLLLEFHFGKAVILQQDHFYRQALADGGAQFRHQHSEPAIANDGD
jgi:hypothetical protein